MKKYIFFLVGLCCALLPAMADQPELLELKASDANIIGHVLDKKTGEHLSYITIALKGTRTRRERRTVQENCHHFGDCYSYHHCNCQHRVVSASKTGVSLLHGLDWFPDSASA